MFFHPHLNWQRQALSLLVFSGLVLGLAACAVSSAPVPRPTPTPSSDTPKLAAPLPRSYAALGASETYGVGANPTTKGYAYLVSRVLQARRFVDVGIPGTTLDQGYDTELADALAIRPSLCTVFFGVNDLRAGVTRQAFLRDLRDLVGTLRSAHTQVLIIGLPDVSYLPAVAHLHFGGLHEIVSSWNAGMARVARETGAHFLNLTRYDAELASHPSYVAPDGLHPSNAGHARLAQVVVAAIKHDGLWESS